MASPFHQRYLFPAVLAVGIAGPHAPAARVTATEASAQSQVASSRSVEEIINRWRTENRDAPLIEHSFGKLNFIQLGPAHNAAAIVTTDEQASSVACIPINTEDFTKTIIFAAIPAIPADLYEDLKSFISGRIQYEVDFTPSSLRVGSLSFFAGIWQMDGLALNQLQLTRAAQLLGRPVQQSTDFRREDRVRHIGASDLQWGTFTQALARAIEEKRETYSEWTVPLSYLNKSECESNSFSPEILPVGQPSQLIYGGSGESVEQAMKSDFRHVLGRLGRYLAEHPKIVVASMHFDRGSGTAGLAALAVQEKGARIYSDLLKPITEAAGRFVYAFDHWTTWRRDYQDITGWEYQDYELIAGVWESVRVRFRDEAGIYRTMEKDSYGDWHLTDSSTVGKPVQPTKDD